MNIKKATLLILLIILVMITTIGCEKSFIYSDIYIANSASLT